MSYSNTISYKAHTGGKDRGAILIELVTAIMIIAALTAVMVSVVATYGRYNTILLTRQRCIAAGRAQLDCLTATGRPIDDATFSRLWPSVKCSITASPGTNDTAGLTKVEVVTAASARKKEVSIAMSRYLAAPMERNPQ